MVSIDSHIKIKLLIVLGNPESFHIFLNQYRLFMLLCVSHQFPKLPKPVRSPAPGDNSHCILLPLSHRPIILVFRPQPKEFLYSHRRLIPFNIQLLNQNNLEQFLIRALDQHLEGKFVFEIVILCPVGQDVLD